MPIGNLHVPGIGKNTLIPMLVVPHTLIATFIIGIAMIGAVSEFAGMVTKRPNYDKFARGAAKFQLLLFATGSWLAFTFFFALITLFPTFWSYLFNIFWWVFLAEAFMFIGEVLAAYAWYYTWDKLAYRKTVHVTIGMVSALFGLAQMIFINVVASYMMSPSNGPATSVGWTFLNPTYLPLNMHRFVGNLSYAGFLIAGWAAWRYLRSTTEENREYYDWLGHWGIMWGFGFLLLQPMIGYEYMTEIRSHEVQAFRYLMMGNKAFLFNALTIELFIMSVTSALYFLHKIKFAVKPMPRLRRWAMGTTGVLAILGVLNMIPADLYIVPQIGMVFGPKDSPQDIAIDKTPPILMGAMYPWKYIGLFGLMLIGAVVLGLYLKASAGGFLWGRVNRWSQYGLILTAVTVTLTMMTMGYARETARRGGPENWLIRGCITFQQHVVSKNCPAGSRQAP